MKLTTQLHLVALHLYSSVAFMPCTGTTLLSLSFCLSASLSSFCSHSCFVLPFVFRLVPPPYLLFLVPLLSSLIIFFRLIFFPLFFLAAFLVLCSLVFRSCTFPSLFRHSPLLQHWDMTHFRYTDTHFMTSHRFMSEGFVIHLVLLKLQEVQYDYISSVRKI